MSNKSYLLKIAIFFKNFREKKGNQRKKANNISRGRKFYVDILSKKIIVKI